MRKKNLTKAVESTIAPNPKEVDIWVEPKDDNTVSLKYYDYHDEEWKGDGDGGSNDTEEIGIILDFIEMYGGFCRFTITPTKNKDSFDVKLETGRRGDMVDSFVQKNIIEEKTVYNSYNDLNYTYKYVEFEPSISASLSGLYGSITQLSLNYRLYGELFRYTTVNTSDSFGHYPSGGAYEDFDNDVVIKFAHDEEGNEVLPNLWIHLKGEE